MKIARLSSLILFAALLWVAGCTQTIANDPLKCWKQLGSISWNLPPPGERQPPLPQAITDDYKDFIAKLPPHPRFKNRSESYFIVDVSFFKDGTGQHAVQISIPMDGTWWKYVLIYDKNNKRTQTIKYDSGHYAC
jgi:hypothetical protein